MSWHARGIRFEAVQRAWLHAEIAPAGRPSCGSPDPQPALLRPALGEVLKIYFEDAL